MIHKHAMGMEIVLIPISVIAKLDGQVVVVMYQSAMKNLLQIQVCAQGEVHAQQSTIVYVRRIGMVHNVISRNALESLQIILKLVMEKEVVSIPMNAIVKQAGKAMIAALLMKYAMEKVLPIQQYVLEEDHV